MTLRLRTCPSSQVRLHERFQVINHYSNSSLSVRSVRAARTGMSNLAKTSNRFSRPLNEGRISEHLPEGWKIRHMEKTEMPKNQELKLNHPSFIRTSQQQPLSYETYKRQLLKTYEQHKRELKPFNYDEETIKKSYELYCRGAYKAYLIELKQLNPGIIL